MIPGFKPMSSGDEVTSRFMAKDLIKHVEPSWDVPKLRELFDADMEK